MTVRIHYAPGELPEFWDRRVVFFANLLSLFYGNEGATEELASTVGGIETYGGRLCPLLNLLFSGQGNLLVLESRPNERLLRYFEEELGLQLPETAILPHGRYNELGRPASDAAARRGEAGIEDQALAAIAAHPAPWIDGFVTDEVLMAHARATGKQTIVTPEISRRGNNKLLLHQYLEQQGFPVFDTEIAADSADVAAAAAALRKKGYRQVVVKAQVGASGIGMRKFDAARAADDPVGEHMFYEGPCLVQGWLDEALPGVSSVGSPSVQMFLNDEAVFLYDVTEQILSAQSIHEGNTAPPPYWQEGSQLAEQMGEQAAASGRWLHQVGYRGTASADFLVVRRRGAIEVRLCEVNARVTGATYPSVLARRFRPGGAWLMRNLRFDPPLADREVLDALRRRGHLFKRDAHGGVLPINFNAAESGSIWKGQFLCLGADESECLEHLNDSAAVLPVTWTYDRD